MRERKLPKRTIWKTAVGFPVGGVSKGRAIPREELNRNILSRIKENAPSILRVVDLELMLGRQAKRLVRLRLRGAINKAEYYASIKKLEEMHALCEKGTCSCWGPRAQSYVDLFAFFIKREPAFKLYYATLKTRGRKAFSPPVKKRAYKRRRRDVVLESEEVGNAKASRRVKARGGDFVETEMATTITPLHELSNQEVVSGVTQAIQRLDPRARELLDLKFGLTDGKPKTLSQIALIKGVGEKEARRILKETLAQLAKNAHLKALV